MQDNFNLNEVTYQLNHCLPETSLQKCNEDWSKNAVIARPNFKA